MSVTVKFQCSGCFAEAEGTEPIRKRHESVFGGSLCAVVTTKIEDVAPEGWVAFDPYTLVTYCPKCWAEIEDPTPAALLRRGR